MSADSYTRIPAELRERPQWVCWRLETRDGGKPTKVPYHVSGRKASSTDARDRVSYTDAVAAYTRCDYDGIGFVFSADDPYCGVDLDHARRPDGSPFDWARQAVTDLASYAEWSPSGYGIHVIARARLLAGGRRCGSIEVYDRARYFTMTGNHVATTPLVIVNAQAAVDHLVAHLGNAPKAVDTARVWGAAPHDGDLRARAAGGRIRRETLALLDSSGPGTYSSTSEADAALCAGLASAGLGAPDMLTLIDTSTRGMDAYRRKGRSHGAYYWRRTIERAVSYIGPIADVRGIPARYGNAAQSLRSLTSRYSRNSQNSQNGPDASIYVNSVNYVNNRGQ